MTRLYRVTILRSTLARPRAGREAAFGRWVVLSDHEQRALEELGRWYVTEAQESVPSRRLQLSSRSRPRSTRPSCCPSRRTAPLLRARDAEPHHALSGEGAVSAASTGR